MARSHHVENERALLYSTAHSQWAGLLQTSHRMAPATQISLAELISQSIQLSSLSDAIWYHAQVVSRGPSKTENSLRADHHPLLLALSGTWLRGEYTGIMQYMLLDVRAWGVGKQPSFHPFQFIITLWGKRNWWLWWAQSSCCFCILRWRGYVFLRPGLWGQPLRLPFTLTLSHRPEYTIGLKSCSVRANF